MIRVKWGAVAVMVILYSIGGYVSVYKGKLMDAVPE